MLHEAIWLLAIMTQLSASSSFVTPHLKFQGLKAAACAWSYLLWSVI